MDLIDPSFLHQQGFPGGSQPPTYDGRRAVVQSDYQSGVNPVTSAAETVSWDVFKWVVTGLLGALLALLVFIAAGVNTRLDNLTTDMNKNNIELVKEVSSIGGKLDVLSQDVRQLQDRRK
jgi:hypothetical protein